MKVNMANRDKVVEELREVVNRNSLENECGTPDYIIAEMLYRAYVNYCDTVTDRDKWWKGGRR